MTPNQGQTGLPTDYFRLLNTQLLFRRIRSCSVAFSRLDIALTCQSIKIVFFFFYIYLSCWHTQANPSYGAGVGGGVPHSPDGNVTNKVTKNVTNTKSHNKQLVIHSHPANQQTSSSNDDHLSSCGKTNPQSINSSHTVTTTPSNNNNVINGVINNPSNPTTTNETIVQLQEMIAHLKAVVNAKDQRIQELERDKDKLRSVLHQQLTSSWVSLLVLFVFFCHYLQCLRLSSVQQISKLKLCNLGLFFKAKFKECLYIMSFKIFYLWQYNCSYHTFHCLKHI